MYVAPIYKTMQCSQATNGSVCPESRACHFSFGRVPTSNLTRVHMWTYICLFALDNLRLVGWSLTPPWLHPQPIPPQLHLYFLTVISCVLHASTSSSTRGLQSWTRERRASTYLPVLVFNEVKRLVMQYLQVGTHINGVPTYTRQGVL